MSMGKVGALTPKECIAKEGTEVSRYRHIMQRAGIIISVYFNNAYYGFAISPYS